MKCLSFDGHFSNRTDDSKDHSLKSISFAIILIIEVIKAFLPLFSCISGTLAYIRREMEKKRGKELHNHSLKIVNEGKYTISMI